MPHTSIVRGPVTSRRYGKSIVLNFLPPGRRVCNFSCSYCSCADTPGAALAWPTPAQLATELAPALIASTRLDAIIISGTGEPTLHPDFPGMVRMLRGLRDRHALGVPLVLLTNGSRMIQKSTVRAVFENIDETSVKVDAVENELLGCLNGAAGITQAYALQGPFALKRSGLRFTTQSMFCDLDGRSNTEEIHVKKWLGYITELMPARAYVYTLARPGLGNATAVSPQTLMSIGQRLTERGVACTIVQ